MNANVKPPLPPMSGEQRSLLRRAVATHQGWKAYRDSFSLSMDKMNNQALWTAANDLGIDAMAVIQGEREHKPRPFDRETCSKLADRFWAVRFGDGMTEKEQTLCIDILATIGQKQDGRATVKQFELVDRIVTRAEETAAAGRQHDTTAVAREAAEAARKAADAFNGNGADRQPELPKAAPEAPKEAPKPFLKATKTPAEQIAEILGSITPQIDEEAIGAIVDARIQAALAGVPTVRIEVRKGEVTNTVEGLHHANFPDLLRILACRTADDKPLNVWLAGPAASGKTTAAINAAKALGLPFYGNGAVSHPMELFGFVDAGGTYHRTPFRDAYENGGVYLWDDTDGSDPNATVAFNMALENGHAPFPDGMVKRHADCVIMATANTWGGGATADYVGRNKLDGAFLDRFGVRLVWDYDTGLETAMSGNAEWAHRVIAARNRARAAGIKVLITPRASKAGAALIAGGFKPDRAAELTYLANLSPEQRNTVEGTR